MCNCVGWEVQHGNIVVPLNGLTTLVLLLLIHLKTCIISQFELFQSKHNSQQEQNYFALPCLCQR